MSPDLDKLRAAPESCPSELTLDQLVAGELSPDDARGLDEHARTCPTCPARIAERRQGFAAFSELDERKVLAGIRRGIDDGEPEKPFWQSIFAPLVAIAGLGLLFVGLRFTSEPAAAPPATRAKGSLALHVFRQSGEHSEQAVSGDTFQPGDRLRFVVDLPQAARVRVLGVEQGGSPYTAWPLEAAAKTRLEAGDGVALPGAVALDASAGRETLYLVACPPEGAEPECTISPADKKPSCPRGCALTSFVLEKKAP